MARTKAKKKGAGAKAAKAQAPDQGDPMDYAPRGPDAEFTVSRDSDMGRKTEQLIAEGRIVPGEPITGAALADIVGAAGPALDPSTGMGDPSTWIEVEDLSDLEPALRDAIIGFDLKRDDVLAHRIRPEGGCVIVTRGGRKVAWPDDQARVLTPEDKGVQTKSAPRFWPEGFLEKGPPKKG